MIILFLYAGREIKTSDKKYGLPKVYSDGQKPS